MPHRTLPRPAADDPIADAVNAIDALRAHVDALFAGAITAASIESLTLHVQAFSQDFEEQCAEAKSRSGS